MQRHLIGQAEALKEGSHLLQVQPSIAVGVHGKEGVADGAVLEFCPLSNHPHNPPELRL